MARAAGSRNPARAAAAKFVHPGVRMLSDEGKAAEKLACEAVGREILQKKDELYNMIAKAEQSYGTRSFQNMRLLQHLSVQVSPRPWDSEWRSLRFSRRVNAVMELAGFIALGGLAGYGSRQYKKCRQAREKLWTMAMEEEEEAVSLMESWA